MISEMEKIKNGNIIGFFVLGLLMGLILLIGMARLSWHTKFYPGVSVAGVEVAGLTREQAKVRLSEVIDNYRLRLTFNGSRWETPGGAVVVEMDDTLNQAYHYGRRLKIEDYLLLLINKKIDYPLVLSEGQTNDLSLLINEIASVVEIPPVEPVIEVVGKKIRVIEGTDGTLLDGALLNQKIVEGYRELKSAPIAIPTSTISKHLTTEKLAVITSRAETLVDKELVLRLDDERIRLETKGLVAFLSTSGDESTTNKEVVDEYVRGLQESLNKDPQDAKFEFVEGKVTEFAPGKDGVRVNLELTSKELEVGMNKLLESQSKSEGVEIVVTRTPPKVTTEKVNELGIKERIGRGESFYQHSIPNRIYNVALASTRINSALIPPGEEVSFNKMVGEVSGATGYRPAYIISGGRTVLGDGGGLCQVSTTMFRAAMSAGLPILERWGHAYRVSYYELNSKPGVDATVIAPSKDFRFKNDTPGHILIQTINDPKALHLVIEIYGTSDGRVTSISEPKVWGNTPPLPTIYQDDPTLPAGTMKQVDWAAPGAKASFEYKVARNGETIQDKTFSTTYRPWASVFLRGTGQ
jgi:vancomycin resistance protein YoaR